MTIKELSDGRLVAPYGIAVETSAQFRFLCRKGAEDRPHVVAFRDWMVEEIAKTVWVHEQMTIIPVEDALKQ
jgi:LysR family glycine cleavage system transcriptional activator